MKRLPCRVVLFAALGLVTMMSACLFDTRTPFPPQTDTCPVIVLDSPEQVFVAITTALQQCAKASNYERAISQTFRFSPTLGDSIDQSFAGTGVFDDWTKPVEMSVVDALLADAKKINVSFDTSRLIDQNAFVRFQVNYTLDVITKAAPTDTTHYAGLADFDVRKESGSWRITYWDDKAGVPGHPTWGYLKGILGLRSRP